jgi:SAM-dependent methyltransferase
MFGDLSKAPLGVLGRKLKYWGRQRYCPACQSSTRRFESYGNPPRADARCPICNSSERERAQVLLLQRRILPRLTGRARLRVLHVAPEAGVARVLRETPRVDYVSGDVEPGRAMQVIDLTNLQMADGSFDFIFLSHVLEHIEDDGRAMAELHRVLAPGGLVFVEVPVPVDRTFEDASIKTPEERLRVFGQEDHVRICGLDYRDRLERAGFAVDALWINELFSDEERARMRLIPTPRRDRSGMPERFESPRYVSWLCAKS